jgi:hypothetical protein
MRRVALVGIAAGALLALTACSSDPPVTSGLLTDKKFESAGCTMVMMPVVIGKTTSMIPQQQCWPDKYTLVFEGGSTETDPGTYNKAVVGTNYPNGVQ